MSLSRTISFPIRSDKLSMNVKVSGELFSQRSQFQEICIFDTDCLGRILTLDGHIQLSTLDEHAYHEALVQVPLLNVNSPKTALIVGGGDGGVLREVCKHDSIERVDFVEIDEMVISACKQHMPTLSAGAFEDPRCNLIIGDAFEFVRTANSTYDLIVVDCTDVYEEEEGELSEMLFTEEFYRDCARILKPNGFVVSQADNIVFCPYSLRELSALYSSVFPVVGSYWALVPSFGGYSAYCWGSHEAKIAEQMPSHQNCEMRYLNGATYAVGQLDPPFVSE